MAPCTSWPFIVDKGHGKLEKYEFCSGKKNQESFKPQISHISLRNGNISPKYILEVCKCVPINIGNML